MAIDPITGVETTEQIQEATPQFTTFVNPIDKSLMAVQADQFEALQQRFKDSGYDIQADPTAAGFGIYQQKGGTAQVATSAEGLESARRAGYTILQEGTQAGQQKALQSQLDLVLSGKQSYNPNDLIELAKQAYPQRAALLEQAKTSGLLDRQTPEAIIRFARGEVSNLTPAAGSLLDPNRIAQLAGNREQLTTTLDGRRLTPSELAEYDAQRLAQRDTTVVSAATATPAGFGTFTNTQGQQVTARTQEEANNMRALGFQELGADTPVSAATPIDPFAGATRVTSPEQLAGLTEEQIIRDPNSDAIYIRSTVNADTKLPQTESTIGVTFQPNISPEQQTGITKLVNSGRQFNETDAANFAYATGQTDASKFVGLTGQQAVNLLQVPPAKNITEITAETPRYQLLDITQNIRNSKPNEMASTDFIDATFRSLHGRSANAKELADFSKMTNAAAYDAILAGAPGNKKVTTTTLADLARDVKSDDPRIDVASGTGELVIKGARRSPGDSLADAAGGLGAGILSEIERIMMQFRQDDLTRTQGKLAEAEGEEDLRKKQLEAIRTSSKLEDSARKLFGDGSRVDEILDALEVMRGQIKNETESLGLGLAGLGNQPIASEIILGQKRVLQEQGLARIGALTTAANAALNEGNLARSVANDIYGAIRDDRNNQIDALRDLLDLATEDRVQLEADEQANIEAQITLLEDANDRMEAEKEDLQSLILDNPLVAAAAGVSLTDTLDQAIAKIQAGATDTNSKVYKLLTASSTSRRTGGGGGGGAAATPSGGFFANYALDVIDLEDALGGEEFVGADAFNKIVDDAYADVQAAGFDLNREQVRQGIIREINAQKNKTAPEFTAEELALAQGVDPASDLISFAEGGALAGTPGTGGFFGAVGRGLQNLSGSIFGTPTESGVFEKAADALFGSGTLGDNLKK